MEVGLGLWFFQSRNELLGYCWTRIFRSHGHELPSSFMTASAGVHQNRSPEVDLLGAILGWRCLLHRPEMRRDHRFGMIRGLRIFAELFDKFACFGAKPQTAREYQCLDCPNGGFQAS